MRGHAFATAGIVLALTGTAVAESRLEFQEARLPYHDNSVEAMAEAPGEDVSVFGPPTRATYQQPNASHTWFSGESAGHGDNIASAIAVAGFSMSGGDNQLTVGDLSSDQLFARTSRSGEGANLARARQGFQIDFELTEASYLELTGQLRTAELTGFGGWGRVWLRDDAGLLFRRERPGSFSSDRLRLPAGAYQARGTFATPDLAGNETAAGGYRIQVQAEPVPLPNAAWLGLSLLAVLAGGAAVRRWRPVREP